MIVVDQLYLTAHHEAGHAVAAVMRGAGELRSITIEGTPEHLGKTWSRIEPFDAAFVTYAGPWAEARADWPHPTLTGEDLDGNTFEDYLFAAWLFNASGDGVDYERHHAGDVEMLGGHADLLDSLEDVWSRELEREWPAIRQIAFRLLAGDVVTDAEVRAARASGQRPPTSTD